MATLIYLGGATLTFGSAWQARRDAGEQLPVDSPLVRVCRTVQHGESFVVSDALAAILLADPTVHPYGEE